MKKVRAQNGFTLLELAIVMLVIGVLASVAVNSFGSATERTRRTDATASLLKLAENQEKYYLINNAYTDVMTDIGGEDTENAYYILSSVIGNAGSTYTLTATAVVGEAQASDVTCGVVTFNSAGQKAPADCW